MEMEHPTVDRISLIASQVRLLADLLLAGHDLQDVSSDAFALVMQDLAARLEQLVVDCEQCASCDQEERW